MASTDESGEDYGRSGGSERPLVATVEVMERSNPSKPSSYEEVASSKILGRLHKFLEESGQPVPLQINGGEPTNHRNLPKIISEAKKMGFQKIELVTDGHIFKRRSKFLKELVFRGLTAVCLRVESLKSAPDSETGKQKKIENISELLADISHFQIRCDLVVDVRCNHNDSELGDFIRFGFKNLDSIRAIHFQNASQNELGSDIPGKVENYSLSNLLQLIEEQSGLPASTFISEPFGRSHCNSFSLVYLVEDRLEPLFKYIVKEDLVKFFGEESRAHLHDMYLGVENYFARRLCNAKGLEMVKKAHPIFGHNLLSVLRSKFLLITVQS